MFKFNLPKEFLNELINNVVSVSSLVAKEYEIEINEDNCKEIAFQIINVGLSLANLTEKDKKKLKQEIVEIVDLSLNIKNEVELFKEPTIAPVISLKDYKNKKK